jgi:YVTN family beta-propeller protein
MRCSAYRNPSIPLVAIRAALPAACAALLLGACGRSSAPPASEARGAPAGLLLYVSNETAGRVDVVDPVRGVVVRQIPVGKRPRGIVLSHDRTRAFVALSGSPIGGPGVDESKLPPADRKADGIGVIDVASHTLSRKYESGVDPETFAVSADDKTIYVSNEDTAEMSTVDVASGAVRAHVKVGNEPEGVTIGPDGKRVYVTCETSNAIYAIDIADNRVAAIIPTSARPRSIVFTPGNRIAFAAAETGGAIDVIDPSAEKVIKTIQVPKEAENPIPPRPMGMALSPDAKRLFVSLGRQKGVIEIDVAAQDITRSIPDVGARPWGIALSPDGTKIYSANGPSGDVSVVDIASGKIERRISVGGSPWGIAVLPPH